ncbi:MAG: hypothetical protein M0Z95_05445 [Actinomycetota bacterium]|nr:hypothetical protein [Actinomycetota bacterium]
MSFFDDFPPPPPPPELQPRRRQPWEGPPRGVIGGWVPWHIVLARSDRAYAVLRDFEAFPSGLHFELVMYYEDDDPTWPMGRRHRMRDPEAFRLGVRFSDGRKTASTQWPSPEDEAHPTVPILHPGGGGGGGGKWEMSYWLWPLPPAGPLTWVASWPEVGANETTVEVDATVLEEAAASAEQLWEEDDSEGGSGYRRMSRSVSARSAARKPPLSD